MSSSNKTLTQIYDRSCERPIPEKKEKSTPSIKPSILGSPCMRKVYYSYNKAPEDIPFPLKSARITNLGNAIGKMLFDAYDKEGIAIRFTKPDGTYYLNDDGTPDYEFRLTCPDLDIKLGKIDIVCVLDDGLWLGEFKSIGENGYRTLRGPKDDHMIQGVLYLFLFNLALKEGLFSHIPQLAKFTKANGVRFVYYRKDKSTLDEFFVTTGDELFKRIVNKVMVVKAHTENGTLPPPTEDYCDNCTYKFRCAKNKKANE